VAPHLKFSKQFSEAGLYIYMYILSWCQCLLAGSFVSCLLSKDDRNPLVEFS
jgi:hypothetical protein